MNHQPLISVVIPTHNRSQLLAKTLNKLTKQEFCDPWELIVVNHRGTDNTDEVVNSFKLPVPLKIVHRSDTPGVAAARNAGAQAAHGRYLLFLDDDILVDSDFLTRHRDALLANPNCWIIGQAVNLPEQETTPFGKFRRTLFSYDPPTTPSKEVQGLNGQMASLPSDDFKRLGGFDESISTASVEDFDLAIRAMAQGIRILYVPSIIVVHNDWAGFTIRDYCHRQRLYAQCEPILWKKYGNGYPRFKFVQSNRPLSESTREPLVFIMSSLKTLFGLDMVRGILYAICDMLEKRYPQTRVLWRLYRLLLSSAIYQGFQEGFTSMEADNHPKQPNAIVT